jgi:hypothetical protein
MSKPAYDDLFGELLFKLETRRRALDEEVRY